MFFSKLFQNGCILSHFFVLIFVVCIFGQALGDVPDMMINTDGTSEIHNEEQIWVSPVDSNVVMIVWRDFRLGYRRVGLGVSTDEGHTWVDSLLSGGPFYKYSDPCLSGDRLGTFYPLTMNYSGYGFSDFTVWKSSDNGASWSGPFMVLGQYADYLEDKEFLAIDRTGGTYDGNMYVAWARFPNPTRIMFVRSTTGGITWDDTLIVGDPADFGGYDAGQFAFPFVDADGNVYVIWRGHCYIPPYWYYCQQMVKSTDGGQSFSDPTTIFVNNYLDYAPGGINIYNSVCMDVDITGGPYHGNIYFTVPDGVEDGPYYHSDILFMKSSDGGNSWISPIRVNDDPLGQEVFQFHQWITVNQKGAIIILFYDQRNDPPYYRKFDTYIAFSFDGGETFTTNYRVSDVSSDPNDALAGEKVTDRPQGTNKPFMSTFHPEAVPAGLLGEYIGVVAYNDQIHCVWTDTRDGNQNVYYSNFRIPLLPPRLFLPENGEQQLTPLPTFWWAACGYFGEVTYDLEISTDSTFATLDHEYIDIDTNIFTVSKPLYPRVPALLTPEDSSTISAYSPTFEWTNESIGSELEYFWRTKAYRIPDDTVSGYSQVWSFTVDASAPVS
ncbi:MAG: sialidase family protein, partial [Candidatus Zixiibacteriota bacterium]